MIVIVILALAFTGLRTPSRIWANAWFTLALLGVTIAIPAAVAIRRRSPRVLGGVRRVWVGLLRLHPAPWVDKEASHQLLTTTILDVASSYIVDNQYLIKNALAVQAINQGIPAPTPTPWQDWNLPNFQPRETWGLGYVRLHSSFLFLRIGHSAFCLLIAVAGGEISRYLHASRQRSQAVTS